MAGQATSNELAALLVARVPAWQQVEHVGYLNSPPINDEDGLVSTLLEAPRTHLWHSAVRRTDRRTAWVYITTIDTTATYTVTVNSVAYAYAASAGDSKADILDGLHGVIEAAAPTAFSSTQVTAADGSGATVALRLESAPSGDSSDPSGDAADTNPMVFDVAPSATGSGEVEVYAEVAAFDYEVWATAARGVSDGPPNSEHWFKVLEASSGDLPQMQILNTAGMYRLAVVVPDAGWTLPAGDVAGVLPAFYVYVGSATDESSEA